MIKKRGKKENMASKTNLLVMAVAIMIVSSAFIAIALPVGPDGLDHNWNETKAPLAAQMINLSGGYVGSYNITADVQSFKWKAFVGQVVGSFTLDDASGNTIYDWTLSSLTGRVFATRNATTPTWGSIACAVTADLEAENVILNHAGASDNITATFADANNHTGFVVGGTNFGGNICDYTVNTYVGDISTYSFEEVALTDSTNVIYATIMEEDATGFDGNTYDFQLLVPEDGSPGYSSATAYYLYVELD